MMSTSKKKAGGGFQSFGLTTAVYKGVMKKGYRLPTPIQRKCIPLIIDGKDVVAMARTGSGKTAAFLIPMFEKLKSHSSVTGARALILSPTRELAAQTMKFTKELGKFTDLRSVLILGGDSLEDHFTAMHNSPDIIIATPGRFLHVVVEMDLKLSLVEYVVFDEADRLFELGFLEQLREILSRLPENRQSLLFSATLPKKLVEFAQAGLSNPVLMRLDVESKLSEQLKLFFYMVREDDKPAILLHLLHHVIQEGHQTLLFTETKHHVEYLKLLCTAANISCTYIYSSLDQAARKLNAAKFVNKEVGLLIVTDVAARGIDIPLLDNVINYNFPATPKLFVHRVGRVARAGRSGTAFSLVSNNEVPYLLDLHLFLDRDIKSASESSNDEDGVVGSVPQSVIDDQDEFIRNTHTTSSELAAAKQVADNAHKNYTKSRVAPSADAIKRARDFVTALPPHPSLRISSTFGGIEKDSLLEGIRGYRPHQTIFEVAASRSKSTAVQVMKSKRQYHSKVISATSQERKLTSLKSSSSTTELKPDIATEQDLESFVTVMPWQQKLANRRHKKKEFKDDDHYIPYIPSDLHTERGLSLGMSGFEQQATGAVLDLMGDEEGDIKRVKGIKTWDRKRKRFVGERETTKKKIKTESGHWINATYKSGLYEEWKTKHKVNHLHEGQVESSDTQLPQGHKRGKWHSKRPKLAMKGAEKRELRTTDEILRLRKKAARNKYKQKSKSERAKRRHRSQQNASSKSYRTKPRGSGKGRRHNAF